MDFNAMFREPYIKHNAKGGGKFINRSRRQRKLCLLLIGYKKFLWKDVISRFKKYIPSDIDVCLISSGIHLNELEKLAEENNWSYLSSKKNNVCLVQNMAITKFPEAELIFKMDEDIFLTEGAFEKLEYAMNHAQNESPYNIGMAAPLLNVNAYGYYRILDKLGKLDTYAALFGKPKMEANCMPPIEANGDAAKFMWGATGEIPSPDKLTELFKDDGYSFCPMRLSIGFVLFRRSLWDGFCRFPVLGGTGMGLDEMTIIAACAALSMVLVVAENCVVGHFSFGPQTSSMRELYDKRHDLFEE